MPDFLILWFIESNQQSYQKAEMTLCKSLPYHLEILINVSIYFCFAFLSYVWSVSATLSLGSVFSFFYILIYCCNVYMYYGTGKIKLSCYVLLWVFHAFAFVRDTSCLFYLKDKTKLVLRNKIKTRYFCLTFPDKFLFKCLHLPIRCFINKINNSQFFC